MFIKKIWETEVVLERYAAFLIKICLGGGQEMKGVFNIANWYEKTSAVVKKEWKVSNTVLSQYEICIQSRKKVSWYFTELNLDLEGKFKNFSRMQRKKEKRQKQWQGTQWFKIEFG